MISANLPRAHHIYTHMIIEREHTHLDFGLSGLSGVSEVSMRYNVVGVEVNYSLD